MKFYGNKSALGTDLYQVILLLIDFKATILTDEIYSTKASMGEVWEKF